MDPVLRSFDPQTQKGGDNDGRYSDPDLDHLIDAASREMKPALRASLIGAALQRVAERFYYLPLHRQMLTWASRAGVHPVIVPSNLVRVDWIRID